MSTSSTPVHTPPPPGVSVIVPVYRGGADFARCLTGLQRLDPPADEIIVVVDGADRDDLAVATDAGVDVVAQAQRGPAAARNTGAARASHPVLLFIDADVVVHPDAVAQVRRHMADPGLDALVGSYDDAPPQRNMTSLYKNLLNHHVHQHAHDEGFTFWGACGAIRRTTFERIGGFDEAYRAPSIEDIELGYRLRAHGGRVRLVKQLQATHLKRWTPRVLLHTDVMRRALPWSRLILDSGRMDDDLNISRRNRRMVALSGASMGCALAAGRWRPLAVPAFVGIAALATLDRRLIGLFARRGGAAFAVAAYAWHLLSYLYAGATFAYAVAERLVRRDRGADGQ